MNKAGKSVRVCPFKRTKSNVRMKVFAVFVVFACVSFAAMGLDCYLCMGSAESDCVGRNTATMMIQHCPIYVQSRNYCVSYSATDGAQMTAGYVRGCGYMLKEDKRDICEYMQSLNMTNDCKACETDLCNV